MGLLRDFYNGAMAIPSSPKPTGHPSSVPNTSTGHKKLDLRGGNYNDNSRFNPNFKYQVQKDLEGTLKSSSTRSAVAGIFYESRGGNGISKGEIKSGLQRLVKQGKINEDQMWAVRRKYGVF